MKCSLLSWMAVSSVCWWGLTNEIQQQRLSLLCSMDSDGESHRVHGSLQVSPLPSTLTGCSHVSSSWGTSPGSWPALGCYLGDEIELPHPRTHHSSWEHLSVARVHSFLALVMFSLSSLKAPASVLFFSILWGSVVEAAPPHWLCSGTAASLLRALEAFFLSLKVPTPLILRDLKMVGNL